MEPKSTFKEDLTVFLDQKEVRNKTINYIKKDFTIGPCFENDCLTHSFR